MQQQNDSPRSEYTSTHDDSMDNPNQMSNLMYSGKNGTYNYVTSHFYCCLLPRENSAEAGRVDAEPLI
jgi:hypothetical protein